MADFPTYEPTARLGDAADARLTSFATGSRFVDVYGHPIEGHKQFLADLASALNEITRSRPLLSALKEAEDFIDDSLGALLPSEFSEADDDHALLLRVRAAIAQAAAG